MLAYLLRQSFQICSALHPLPLCLQCQHQRNLNKIVYNWRAIIVSLTNSMSSLQSWMKTCRKYFIILGCSYKRGKFCVYGRSATALLIPFTIHYVYIIRSTMLVIIVFSYPPLPLVLSSYLSSIAS